jgi:hypothetical protein
MKTLMGFAAAVIAGSLMMGCGQTRTQEGISGSPPSPLPSTQPSTALDEAKVIAIAKQAVAAQDTWAERAVYEAKHQQDRWVVMAWRIEGYDSAGKPQFVPGGHRFITIDEHGSIISYIRGR